MSGKAQQQSRIKELILLGREQGYLTYAEVNDHLPEDISDPEIQSAISGKLKVGSDFSPVEDSSIVIICVPTPLDVDRKPDLSLIDAAVKSFAKHLSK